MKDKSSERVFILHKFFLTTAGPVCFDARTFGKNRQGQNNGPHKELQLRVLVLLLLCTGLPDA
jgi:hypothetical protein